MTDNDKMISDYQTFSLSLTQGQIKMAKQRVVLASLYLGTGALEQELVRVGVAWVWWDCR